MQLTPTPAPGWIVGKQKKPQDVVKLGFDLPDNYGKNERQAMLCEVIAVGERTPEQSFHLTNAGLEDSDYPNIKAGDLVAYAPFSDAKVTLGTQEWSFIEFKSILGNFGKVEEAK